LLILLLFTHFFETSSEREQSAIGVLRSKVHLRGIMLVVTSLAHAHAAVKQFAPARVISLLSEDKEMPTFDEVAEDSHLKLRLEGEACQRVESETAKERARDIIEFLNKWNCDGNLVVHCEYGVSRSTATAFVSLCVLNKDASEEELLLALRKLAPHADPCPSIVSYADDLLHRNGRMVDALLDFPPPVPCSAAPIICLPTPA